MFQNDIIPPSWYAPIFQCGVLLMVLCFVGICYSGAIILNSTRKSFSTLVFLFIIITFFFVASRPNSIYFGDTVNYTRGFIMRRSSGAADALSSLFSFKGEFFFNAVQDFCVQFANVQLLFAAFAFIYFFGQYFTCKRWCGSMWYIPYIAMASMIDYWGFAVNGVRNGAAASLMILAISYGRRYSVSIPLAILAIGTHTSMLLLAVSAVCTRFYRNTRAYLAVWVTSIFVSLIAGRKTSDFLISILGDTDKRLENYNNMAGDSAMMAHFSSSGFRVDFLIYSAIPIVVGYQYVKGVGKEDDKYRAILNIYIIANTFWLLMMYCFSSNRFAALSWFMAGLVLMYPTCRELSVTRNYKRIAAILLIWYSFCFIQNIIKPYIL